MRRLFLKALPPLGRDWGRALLAEARELRTSRERMTWLLGGVVVFASSWSRWMTKGNLVKTVVTTLSVVNVIAGVYLGALYSTTDGNPPLVLALAIGLTIQGGYTLWYMRGQPGEGAPWLTQALLAGETIALLVGLGGFVIAALNNIDPPNSDPEYGPMAVGGLIAAQSTIALYIYAVKGEAGKVNSPGGF